MSLEELQQLEEQATASVVDQERLKMSDFMSTMYLSLCPEWRHKFLPNIKVDDDYL